MLRARDAVEPSVRARWTQSCGRIKADRQVQGCEDRWAGRRQIGIKVHAMHVDEVDRKTSQCRRDCITMPLAGRSDRALVKKTGSAWDGDERTSDAGPLARHNDRAVA